jgi:hypothetical protein
MVNEVIGKRKYQRAKTGYLEVVVEVDTVVVVEHSEGERLEKGLESLVLRLRRACIFECKANEGWAVVPFAGSWLHLFEVRDDAAEPVNGLGAWLLIFKNRGGFRLEVNYALQGRLVTV